jgi:hypothetical protein
MMSADVLSLLSSDELKAEMQPRPLRLGRRGRPRWLPESNQGAASVTPGIAMAPSISASYSGETSAQID